MERRDFLKKGCVACVALGSGIVSSTLSSCNTLPIIRTDVESDRIFFDPALFTDEVSSILLRTKKLEYDVLVIKGEDSGYRAVYMNCTHNHFALSSNKKQIFCNSHGAEFDFDGNVLKGPATKKLKTFQVINDEGGKLFVHIN